MSLLRLAVLAASFVVLLSAPAFSQHALRHNHHGHHHGRHAGHRHGHRHHHHGAHRHGGGVQLGFATQLAPGGFVRGFGGYGYYGASRPYAHFHSGYPLGGYYGYSGLRPYPVYGYYQWPYLPPVFAPAGVNYGPGAVKEFMGVDRDFALGPLASKPQAADPPVLVEAEKPLPEPEGIKVREANWAARELAQKQLDIGDSLFQRQKHHEALQRYKTAAKVAPDMAEAYLRQGFALIATNRYELAATAIKRGLGLDPSLKDSGFLLSSLYGETLLAKTSHLDSLARRSLDEPRDPDLLFLLGVFLHYDGEKTRADKFFAAARSLIEENPAAKRDFLGGPADAERPAILPE